MDTPQVLLIIKNTYSQLGVSLKRIADLALEHPQELSAMNIKEIATACEVSIGSVTRFIKILGYKNFKAFQLELTRGLSDSGYTGSTSTLPLDTSISFSYELENTPISTEEISKKVFQSNIQMLMETMQSIDYETLEMVTNMILSARNLVFLGAGRSHIVAESARTRFYRLGLNAFSYWDAHEQIVASTLATPDDLVIGISNYGHSASVVNGLTITRRKGVKTIGITSVQNSPITAAAQYNLVTIFNHKNLEFQPTKLAYEPASENITQMVVIDCLYMNVVARLGKEAVNSIFETTRTLNIERV